MKKAELLAPAGSIEALKAAVRCGVDAVYFGLNAFSARDGAQNISGEELTEAVRFCHVRSSKAYAALNTLILDREYRDFAKCVEDVTLAGADGVILQDLGAAQIVKKVSPEMPIHASTQMSVHSLEGVEFLKNQGFSRIVLARELGRDEVKYICENTDAEIEVFVHGALCVCYSGKCLLSSMIGRRSGNRGKCAQPCRLPYNLGGENGYFLSPHDLCLLDDVRDMSKFGVASLKIEGRMKSPQYVALVTSIYRKALDGGKITDADRSELREIFCRGERFTRGYFGGEGKDEIINKSLSNEKTGRTASAKLLNKANNMSEKEGRCTKISINLSQYGDIARLSVKKDGICADEEMTMTAPPLTNGRVYEQLAKLGNTPFEAEKIEINGEIGLKISEINELRRKCCARLEEKIYESRKKSDVFGYESKRNVFTKPEFGFLSAYVSEPSQAQSLSGRVKKIYLPLSLGSETEKLAQNTEVSIVLPAIIRREEQGRASEEIKKAISAGASEIVLQSVDNIEFVKEIECKKAVGFEMNVTNSESIAFFEGLGISAVTLSPELSFETMKGLSIGTGIDINAVIYGRLPLMHTQLSIIGGKNSSRLEDRTGAKFPIRKEQNGRNVIYNSRPLYLADKDYDKFCLGEGILYFTAESGAECAKILDMYEKKELFNGEFTRGYQCGGKY